MGLNLKPGVKGSVEGERFEVLACIELEDDESVWEECALQLGSGEIVWLDDDQGQLFLSRETQIRTPAPSFEAARVGDRLALNGQSFAVSARVWARVRRIDGALPDAFQVGDELRYLDGHLGSQIASLEYSEDEVSLTVSSVLLRSNLQVDATP